MDMIGKKSRIKLVSSLFLFLALFVLIVLAAIPTQDNPLLNATTNDNADVDNLTCWNQTTDGGSVVYNSINWYKDNISLSILNMPMDINASDFSGLSNDGVVTNAVLNTTDCKIGNCYTFDGTGDYITVADSSSIDSLNISQEMTVCAWVLKSVEVDGEWEVVSKDRWEDSSPFQFGISGNNCTFFATIPFTASSCSIQNYAYGSGMLVGQWYHICGLFNGTAVEVYWDGNFREASTACATPSIPENDRDLIIGGRTGENYFTGNIDGVQIFNISLSRSQIKAIYNYENTYNQQCNVMVSEEVNDSEIWSCSMIPNDLTDDGLTKFSNNITIGVANADTVPNFDSISNFVLVSNWGEKKLTITSNVSDVEDADSALKYMFTNSNTDLLDIDINNVTGEVNFTALNNNIGVSTINISVIDTDGNKNSTKFDIQVVKRVLKINYGSLGGQDDGDPGFSRNTNNTHILDEYVENNVSFIFFLTYGKYEVWLKNFTEKANDVDVTLCLDTLLNANISIFQNNSYPNLDGTYSAFIDDTDTGDLGNETWVREMAVSFADYVKAVGIECIDFNEDGWKYNRTDDVMSGYSQADLEDFRIYTGNFTALLPVDTNHQDGTRTINVTSNHPLWHEFYQWKFYTHKRYVRYVCSEFKQKVENGTCIFLLGDAEQGERYGISPGVTFTNGSYLDMLVSEGYSVSTSHNSGIKQLSDDMGIETCGFVDAHHYDTQTWQEPTSIIKDMLVNKFTGMYCDVMYYPQLLTPSASNNYNLSVVNAVSLGRQIISNAGLNSLLNDTTLRANYSTGIVWDWERELKSYGGTSRYSDWFVGVESNLGLYKTTTIFPPITTGKLDGLTTLVLTKHEVSGDEWDALIKFQDAGGNVVYTSHDQLVPDGYVSPLQEGSGCASTDLYISISQNMTILFGANPNKSQHTDCYQKVTSTGTLKIADNTTFITNNRLTNLPERAEDNAYTYLNISAGATAIVTINSTADVSYPVLTYYKRNATSGFGVWIGIRSNSNQPKTRFENNILMLQNSLNVSIYVEDDSVLDYINKLSTNITQINVPYIFSDKLAIFNNASNDDFKGWYVKNNDTFWQFQSLVSEGIDLNLEAPTTSTWEVNGTEITSDNSNKTFLTTTMPMNTYWYIEAITNYAPSISLTNITNEVITGDYLNVTATITDPDDGVASAFLYIWDLAGNVVDIVVGTLEDAANNIWQFFHPITLPDYHHNVTNYTIVANDTIGLFATNYTGEFNVTYNTSNMYMINISTPYLIQGELATVQANFSLTNGTFVSNATCNATINNTIYILQENNNWYENSTINISDLVDNTLNEVNISCFRDWHTSGNTTGYLNVSVDSVNPSLTIFYPVDGYTPVNARTVNFTFNCSDVNFNNAYLTINGLVNRTFTSAINGEIESFNIAFFNDVYSWNVSCVDNAGNVNTSTTRTFTINVDNPVGGGGGSSGCGGEYDYCVVNSSCCEDLFCYNNTCVYEIPVTTTITEETEEGNLFEKTELSLENGIDWIKSAPQIIFNGWAISYTSFFLMLAILLGGFSYSFRKNRFNGLIWFVLIFLAFAFIDKLTPILENIGGVIMVNYPLVGFLLEAIIIVLLYKVLNSFLSTKRPGY